MIASLPMYDWPEMQAINDRLWAGIRDRLRQRGITAPEALCRDDRAFDWEAPDLLLSQTCSLPYRTVLHDKVALVGTPDYGLDGASPGHYYSFLVVRADRPGNWTDHLDGILAINGYDSQSGWGAPQNHAAAIGRRFSRIHVTGAHRDSATAVAQGQADIAAIDAVTWRLVNAYCPEVTSDLRICAKTVPTPGLPLISAPGNDAAVIAQTVRDAIAALAPEDLGTLGLRRMIQLPVAAYLAVPTPKRI